MIWLGSLEIECGFREMEENKFTNSLPTMQEN
jgi:hypothetical protein